MNDGETASANLRNPPPELHLWGHMAAPYNKQKCQDNSEEEQIFLGRRAVRLMLRHGESLARIKSRTDQVLRNGHCDLIKATLSAVFIHKTHLIGSLEG